MCKGLCTYICAYTCVYILLKRRLRKKALINSQFGPHSRIINNNHIHENVLGAAYHDTVLPWGTLRNWKICKNSCKKSSGINDRDI